jgi:hypothetical protein
MLRCYDTHEILKLQAHPIWRIDACVCWSRFNFGATPLHDTTWNHRSTSNAFVCFSKHSTHKLELANNQPKYGNSELLVAAAPCRRAPPLRRAALLGPPAGLPRPAADTDGGQQPCSNNPRLQRAARVRGPAGAEEGHHRRPQEPDGGLVRARRVRLLRRVLRRP